MDTKIVSQLAVDEPLVQDADYRFDEHDRRYIDRQILGVEQHLVEALIRGRHATYVEVAPNSVPLQKGMAVCLASMQGSEPLVTFPSAPALDNAVSVFGVVVYSGNPGAKALIAVGGVLPPSITGLATGAKGYVRVNTSTGRLERVISLSPGDYGVGTVDNAGFMHVIPGITVGGGGGGDGEANFGENLPGGVGVYDGKLGVNLQFRPITGTGGIAVNLNGDVIEVDGSSIGAVTGENIGDGADIFAGKVGNNLQLRGIKGTGGITATVNGDNIEIDGGALGANGEANDGANLPGGVGVYDGKDGVTLQFRPLSGTGGINVGLNGDVIEIDGSGIGGGGGPPSGNAGGDLSGTYPNPTVARINGATVPVSGALTTGNIIFVSGPSALSYGPLNLAGGSNYVTGQLPAANQAPQTMGGDVTGTTASATVAAVRGATVGSAGGALTTGNVLKVTGSSTIDYGPVNLGGGSGHVTGVTPISNGGTGSSTIGSNNTVATSQNGTEIFWKLLTNANISASAGITVSKLMGGANNQLLKTVSGVPTWSTVSLSDFAVPGSNGQILYNNNGSVGASSSWSFSSTGIVGGGFISFGNSLATNVGYIRIPYNGGAGVVVIAGRNSANNGDHPGVTWGSGHAWTFGSASANFTALGVVGTSSFGSEWSLWIGGSRYVQAASGAFSITPNGGQGVTFESGFAKFGSILQGHASSNQALSFGETTKSLSGAGPTTLTASEYCNPVLVFTGSPTDGHVVNLPTGTLGVWIIVNGCSSRIAVKIGSGTLNFSPGESAIVRGSTHIQRITPPHDIFT